MQSFCSLFVKLCHSTSPPADDTHDTLAREQRDKVSGAHNARPEDVRFGSAWPRIPLARTAVRSVNGPQAFSRCKTLDADCSDTSESHAHCNLDDLVPFPARIGSSSCLLSACIFGRVSRMSATALYGTPMPCHRPSVPTVWKMTRWKVDAQFGVYASHEAAKQARAIGGHGWEQGVCPSPSFLVFSPLPLRFIFKMNQGFVREYGGMTHPENNGTSAGGRAFCSC